METKLGKTIETLILACGFREKVIEILQRCTTAENIETMSDDELVELWFQRWILD